jgi:hypothetical protein
MKMDTPFSGTLALLGATGRNGIHLSLRGQWELREGGAPVYHRPAGLEGAGATVIGQINALHVWSGMLYGTGDGVPWLANLLQEGSHALALEMDIMRHDKGMEGAVPGRGQYIVGGRVYGALIVKASAFNWHGMLTLEGERG